MSPWVLNAGLAATGLGIVAATVLALGHDRQSAAPRLSAGTTSRVTPLGGVAAPDFGLTDQDGRSISMSAFRGQVVVLDFMDPECTKICPIVSREYVTANRELGDRARGAEFVAVNVNEFHRSVQAVRAFTNKRRLGGLRNWHFLTGSTAALRRVWADYGVFVQPRRDGDVVHSSLTYFIDRSGKERYLMQPRGSKSSIAAGGKAIARVVKTLL